MDPKKKKLALIFALVVLVIGLIMVIVFSFLKRGLQKEVQTILLKGQVPSDDLPRQGFPLVQSYQNIEFTYLFYIFFMNVPYISLTNTSSHIIFDRNADGDILYDHVSSSLLFRVRMKIDGHEVSKIYNILRVPLQKWIRLAIVVKNRKMDIFMDGQLTKSIFMDNVLILYIGNEGILRRGWYGALADFKIYNYVLSDNVILDDYSKRADKSFSNPMDFYGRFRKS